MMEILIILFDFGVYIIIEASSEADPLTSIEKNQFTKSFQNFHG